MAIVLDWIENYERLIIGLGVASVVLFLGSVLVIPLIIAYLPADYFARTLKPLRELSLFHTLGRCLKNTVGLFFLFLGFVMLFIPGQGILTILLGLSLIDFPGKRRFEIRILNSPRARKLIQWCRQKSGRDPLLIPER